MVKANGTVRVPSFLTTFSKNLHLVWLFLTCGVKGPAQVSINISEDEFLYICLIYSHLFMPIWRVETIYDMLTSLSNEDIMHKGVNRSGGLLEAKFCEGFCLPPLPTANMRGNSHSPVGCNTSPGGFSYGLLTIIFESLTYAKRLLIYFFGLWSNKIISFIL